MSLVVLKISDLDRVSGGDFGDIVDYGMDALDSGVGWADDNFNESNLNGYCGRAVDAVTTVIAGAGIKSAGIGAGIRTAMLGQMAGAYIGNTLCPPIVRAAKNAVSAAHNYIHHHHHHHHHHH